jgi:hypothetical protein
MPEPPVQKHLCAVYSLWWQASTKAKWTTSYRNFTVPHYGIWSCRLW